MMVEARRPQSDDLRGGARETKDQGDVANAALADQYDVAESDVSGAIGASPQEEEPDTIITDADTSGLPTSVCISQREEYSLPLAKVSPRQKRSPMRGVLRAVSSMTITDIEDLEVGISSLVRNSATIPLKSDQSPSKAAGQQPRRGNSRRRRDQKSTGDLVECACLGEELVRPGMMPCGPPFVEENNHLQPSMRRKSFDILPNVPRRVSSDKDLVELGGESDNDEDDAVIERFIEALHDQVHTDSPESAEPRAPLQRKRSKSFDQLSSVPRRSFGDGPVTDDGDFFIGTPLDRFSSEPYQGSTVLERKLSLDQILMAPREEINPIAPGSPVPPPRNVESESEPEGSPFRVREFVVSLDYLEDKKARGDMPKRRRSLDALPTPPRRFLDEFAGLDLDTDDESDGEEDGANTKLRRSSFDDVPSPPRRPSYEARLLNTVADLAYDIDQSHRTQITRDSDGEEPVRRKSIDMLPSLPRRRLASDVTDSSSDQSELLLPLNDGSKALRRMTSDVLPSAPRRSDSGASMSYNEFRGDQTATQSSNQSKPGPNDVFVIDDKRLSASSDRLPAVPVRDFSLPSINVGFLGSFSVDETQDGSGEKLVNSGLESDLESADGGIMEDKEETTNAHSRCEETSNVDDDGPANDSAGTFPALSQTTETSASVETGNLDEDKAATHPIRRPKKKSSFLERLFARND
jgi:hypothetical protein